MRLAIADSFSLPPESVTETFAILANRGKGKSNTATVLVEQMHAAGLPVVVLDVKGDWWGIRSSADGKGPGLPFIIFGGDHPDVPLEPTAGALLADLIVDERINAVVDMSAMSKSKARSFTVDFAERLYRKNRDALHVVVEEADVLIPQRATAETARLLGAMEDLAKRGRNRGIGMTVVTQRPQEVAKSVLDLMETLILLGMTGPRSIAAIKDWISTNADDMNSATDVVASLPSLDVGEAWIWSPAFLRVLKRVRICRATTFDSHATPAPGQVRRQPKGRADIDLAAIGERISATVEKAKADDPRELRKRIAELEKQLAAKPEPRIIHVEVPVLSEQERAKFEQYLGRAEEAMAGLSGALIGIAVRWKVPTGDVKPLPAAVAARPVAPRVLSDARPTAAVSSRSGEVHLKAGARRILETMARHHPALLTVSQIGTLAKFKTTGGTWGTYWSAIRRAGYIEQAGDGFRLTSDGLDYIGVEPGNPSTTEEILDQWRSALKAGARQMLDTLVGVYPKSMTRDELAVAVDMTASGGTFGTYLGTLRRNGLISVDGDDVTASDTLFLGGAR